MQEAFRTPFTSEIRLADARIATGQEPTPPKAGSPIIWPKITYDPKFIVHEGPRDMGKITQWLAYGVGEVGEGFGDWETMLQFETGVQMHMGQ